MGGDGAEPVVAGEAAAFPRLQPAGVEIDLVVDDQNRVGLELEEAGGGSDGAAGLIHERLGFEQANAMAVEAQLGQTARELSLPGRAVSARELVHNHPADVVSVA